MLRSGLTGCVATKTAPGTNRYCCTCSTNYRRQANVPAVVVPADPEPEEPEEPVVEPEEPEEPEEEPEEPEEPEEEEP